MTANPIIRRSPDRRSTSLEPWPLRGRALGEILATYAVLTLVGLALGWLLLSLLGETSIANWDRSLAIWFAEQRTNTLNTLSNMASALSDTTTIVVGLLVMVPTFTWTWKRWRESLTLAVALILESTVVLTVTAGRDRPPVEQLDASPPTASFPSGHTGAAFAFYWALALIVYWNTENRALRTAATVVALVVPVLVALSRMYRGMHYLTDVLVGGALGVTCTLLAAWLVTRAVDRRSAKETS
jgi:membrane-associated phospholipid phosphatase